MVQITYTTTKEGQINADYSVKLIGTAESGKNLKETVHIPSVRTKKQVSEIAGERSFLYGMYLSYLKRDPDFECQVSVDVLPSNESATPTKIEVSFTGTATSAINLDFGFLDTEHNIKLDFANGTSATQIAEALITEAKKWDDIPFDVESFVTEATKITFTSRVLGSVGSYTPIKAILKGSGITSQTTITAGTGDISADEMISYINSKEIKNRLYIFEDGIKVNNFIKELKKWQDYKDCDKRGRMIQTKVGTLEDLIEEAEGLNESSQSILGLKKVSKEGYVSGHIFTQPCYFSAMISGMLNLAYTQGTKFGQISSNFNGGLGDPSNVSLPFAGITFEDYGIIEGEEWLQNEDGNEIKLLEDSGICVFKVNKTGNLVVGNLTTTYTKDKEGNKDVNFHWMAFDESVSSFLSYMYARQKRTLAHKRMEEKITKALFIADCQGAYRVCSGQENDSELKRSFKFVEPAGLNNFLNTLGNGLIEDYSKGDITCQATQTAVYAQLRSIFHNFKFGYNS